MRICTSLFLFFALWGLSISHAQNISAKTCGEFKTGTFVYVSPDLPDVVVKRTNKKQTETIGKGREKKSFTFDIVWTSPCDYTLTVTDVSDYHDRKQKGTKLYIQISAIEGDSYKFVSYDGAGNRNEGKVRKIK